VRKATPQQNAEKQFHCSFEICKLLTLVTERRRANRKSIVREPECYLRT
jgi:hypothetical protein